MSPFSLEAPLSTARDHQECRAAIRMGSRTFYAASKLLPRSVRRPAFGLYAFCRLSDDAVDIGTGSLEALERLRVRLARAGEGRPLPFAADRAMADLMRRHAVPRAIPEALLEGLAWDADGRRFETLEDLHDYAARVAGTVGVMMTLLMGVREPEALARACDLGVAMQLTNIARDVGEDARNGRIYLPLQWMRAAGIDPQSFIADPKPGAALSGLIRRLLVEADRLYANSRSGIAALPAACRPAIMAAALIYAEIGREVERREYDCVTQRARVSGKRKLSLLARATAEAIRLRCEKPSPPSAATAFLVDAVKQSRLAPTPPLPAIDAIRLSILRVLKIFERLERAEQFGD